MLILTIILGVISAVMIIIFVCIVVANTMAQRNIKKYGTWWGEGKMETFIDIFAG